MAIKRYNLAEMAYPDIQEFLKDSDVIMIPFGSCEMHGQHLPLGTDSFHEWGYFAVKDYTVL
jgi:creatinine amidohydrolase